MATEFFAEGGSDVAITLTPGEHGILQVHVDGDKIFDKSDEGNKHADLPRVKELRAVIRERVAALVAAGD
jgi:predicted Rdx family selenoprotein